MLDKKYNGKTYRLRSSNTAIIGDNLVKTYFYEEVRE